MNLVQEIGESIRICYPDFWAVMNPTQRAQAIGRACTTDEGFWEVRKKIGAIRAARRRKIEIANARKAKKQRHWLKMHKIVCEAEQYYGDIVYEWCGGSGSGDREEEEKVFGKIERGEFDDDACKREALYTAFGHLDKDCDWYDKVVKFWNNRF